MIERALLLSLALSVGLSAQQPAAGVRLFEARCAGCHGTDGAGGEHGPTLVEPRRRDGATRVQDVREIIRKGIPEGGMPAFPSLSEADLDAIVARVQQLRAPAADNPAMGDASAGQGFFSGKGNCTKCHMVNGTGGLHGPDLTKIALERTLVELEQAIVTPDAQIRPGYQVVNIATLDGGTVRGFLKAESLFDVQIHALDGTVRSFNMQEISGIQRESKSLMPALRASPDEKRDLLAYLSGLKAENAGPLTSQASADSAGDFSRILAPAAGDWPSYHGLLSGNRMSPLDQIHTGNVSTLGAKWMFPIPSARRLEVTPVVIDGVMYVTAPNEVYALDARSGREIWHYARPRTAGVIGDAGSGINRGVAVLGDKVFLATDHAHLLALNRWSGQLIWEVEMADFRQHYGLTSAPLIVRDLVLIGSSGGDEGARGFIDAYRAASGERVWRFWTVPAPGEPGSETWQGRAIEHPCAAPWLTGTYDAETNLTYWPTGNPCPDYNGDERKGDNLYSSSVLALDPDTGKLRWYYQFTPHDLHDWDANQTPVVVNADFGGRPRKLLLQANRNGFFYVLDRTSGEFLLGQPFVRKMTWATGVGSNGRPIMVPNQEPSVQGTRTCPSVAGATNWMSTAYNPATGLYYVMAQESCAVFTKSSAWWEPGKSFYGGGARRAPGDENEKYVRAIDIGTGKLRWEVRQPGRGSGWGGLMSTAGGLVIYCDESGALAALDAKTGKPLWHFHTNQNWRASPMTYMAAGKQYIAVAAGSNIISFALP